MLSFTVGGKRFCVKKDIIVPLIMLVFTIAYYVSARNLSSKSLAFPRIFLAILFMTSVYSIIKDIKVLTPEEAEEQANPLFTKKIILYFLAMLAFVLLLPIIGIYIAIPTFLIITMLALGLRNIKVLIMIPICVTVLIHLLFVVLLSTPLPVGPF